MPRKPQSDIATISAVADLLAALGAQIADARKRRAWTQAQLAARAGVSVLTIRAVERGHPGTGIGAYLSALWAMGLEAPVRELASPARDEVGMTLQAARNPKRVRAKAGLDDDF